MRIARLTLLHHVLCSELGSSPTGMAKCMDLSVCQRREVEFYAPLFCGKWSNSKIGQNVYIKSCELFLHLINK